jgi:hypothetical protein
MRSFWLRTATLCGVALAVSIAGTLAFIAYYSSVFDTPWVAAGGPLAFASFGPWPWVLVAKLMSFPGFSNRVVWIFLACTAAIVSAWLGWARLRMNEGFKWTRAMGLVLLALLPLAWRLGYVAVAPYARR